MNRPARIEKPGPGQESVWDYPRPPRVEDVPHELVVEHAVREVARTSRGKRVIETAGAPVYYFPPGDIDCELIEEGRGQSFCEWKGLARYWDVVVDGERVANAGWSYPNPSPGFEEIQDWVAFYAQKMDICRVGGWVAEPQPGHFYGGWVTPNLVGPIKGEPGSEGW